MERERTTVITNEVQYRATRAHLGRFDQAAAFEIGVHAIVNQDLDHTPTGDALATLARSHGTPVAGLTHGLAHAFPSAETLADADLGDCGLPRRVSATITDFAIAVATGTISLNSAASLDELVRSLTAISGLESSAAHQIALRLGHHDAFPHADPSMRHSLELLDRNAIPLDDTADGWRPWRALATTHLAAHANAGAFEHS